MILPFGSWTPSLAPTVYVAPTATVIGNVEVGEHSSLWYGTVVRGDVESVRIGHSTNIQDGCVLHATGGGYPLTIGDGVTAGHRAVVHGCTIGSRVLLGMGCLVLDGAVIGEESVVGAGAVVPEGASFPPRSVLLGIPARRVREVNDADLARIHRSRDEYLELSLAYRKAQP